MDQKIAFSLGRAERNITKLLIRSKAWNKDLETLSQLTKEIEPDELRRFETLIGSKRVRGDNMKTIRKNN